MIACELDQTKKWRPPAGALVEPVARTPIGGDAADFDSHSLKRLLQLPLQRPGVLRRRLQRHRWSSAPRSQRFFPVAALLDFASNPTQVMYDELVGLTCD